MESSADRPERRAHAQDTLRRHKEKIKKERSNSPDQPEAGANAAPPSSRERSSSTHEKDPRHQRMPGNPPGHDRRFAPEASSPSLPGRSTISRTKS